MNKETQKKLIKDFPKNVINKAPQGKFGDYISHGIITKRLIDVAPDYNFTYEVLRDKDNAIVGAKCRLEIPGLGIKEDVGDVDVHAIKRNLTESELLKLAVSDGIKRCAMRFGLGLDQLWNQGVTEESHYSVQQPIQKTGRVKDIVIENEDAALNKAKQDFAKDIGAEEDSVSNQLNDILEGMCPDKEIRNEVKKSSYKKCIEEGFSKEVDDWTDDNMKTFLGYFGDTLKNNAELLDTLTEDISHTKMQCPDCQKFEWIVDNREKKASDDKFLNIPDFTCDSYGADKDGCGKGWYIGSKDFPFDKWL
jgi:hypothetical protein|tara:strand:+ start:417 stop:1337 length:921 start_codon:yes stop_codon:yes gene_type:complete